MTHMQATRQHGTGAATRGRRSALRFGTLVSVLLSLCVSALTRGLPQVVYAQQQYPSTNCVVTSQNRNSQVNADGTFLLPNVPAAQGTYRTRVVCPQPDGTVLGSTSAPLVLTPNGYTVLPLLPLLPMQPQPASINLLVDSGNLGSVGSTVQLQTQSVDPGGYGSDVTAAANGTTYETSNIAVATVSASGLVTATGPGAVLITARNDGLVGTIQLQSFGLLDSDGDGMPDVYEVANGLNPFDPTDAAQDPDNDGLTNLQEYQLGTNPRVADTDGDGVNDGQEVSQGTNPLNPDTDGDGLTDGQEATLGTNPLVADTDGDGIPDGVEVRIGTNPLVADVTTTVTGYVTSPTGTPFVGAGVVVFTYFTVNTDSTGAFTLLHVPTTLGNITASAEAISGTTVYNGASRPTPGVGNGVTNVGTIQLGQSAGTVSGAVTGPAGNMVAGAAVTIVDGTDTRTTVTNGSGLYSVSGLAAGMISVAVSDPATALRGTAGGMLVGSGPLSLNVRLGGFGTVSGTVRTAAGVAVGAGIPVTIAGSLNASTTTNSLGQFSFAFVPLGPVTVDATDSNGNHGRTAAIVSATSQVINADVQFLGRGTVSGTVVDSTGNAAAGAAVALHNDGVFSQSLAATADGLGHFSFPGVFVGSISLSASSGVLGGNATVVVQSDGQTVSANITLQAAGTIAGTIYRADGKTTVPGAAVNLQSTAFSTTADANGKYTLSTIPVGSYTVLAVDSATTDRGFKSTALTAAGQTATADINMLGLGTVNVAVKDGGGNPAPNAVVTIATGQPFYLTQTAVADSTGAATFNQQLGGNLSLRATDPVTGLAGTATATLTAGGTVSVTVTLQSAGTITGHVYDQNGSTPIAAVTVKADTGEQVQTDVNGLYTLTVIPSGTHLVQVLDSVGNVLAYNGNIAISTQGQVATANFVIVGRGTVTGIVTNPDGSPSVRVPVQILSVVSGFSSQFGAVTDSNGSYTITGIPVGGYAAFAQQYALGEYGQATGAIPSDGATVTTNIQVSSSYVPATTNYVDGNGSSYPLRPNGGLFDGSFSVFAGDSGVTGNPLSPNRGGALLSLVQGGVETAFNGSVYGSTSLNGREITVAQNGLNGLNVSREIYIPGDGYFARYVELLSNPSSQPITTGAKLTSYFRSGYTTILGGAASYRNIQLPHILQTSSGDNLLNVTDPSAPDHWVTFGGATDIDPFVSSLVAQDVLPPVADVFSGPGAPLQPTSATYVLDPSGNFSTLTENFGSITVPAGGTVGILHFVSEQNIYAAANGSAARLAQLPPEALAGLSPSDLASIRNFAVPATGASTLAGLPALNGTISGYVYGADGITPVSTATVSLQSSVPEYQRTYTTNSQADGGYLFQGGNGLIVPVANFTASAIDQRTQRTSSTAQVISETTPSTGGTFPNGSAQATQNLLFSNDGVVSGVVSLGPNVLNVSGTVTLTGGGLSPLTLPINGDGTYAFPVIPAGTYALQAAVTNTLLTGTATAVVTAGSTTRVNITIQTAGSISGSVTRADGSLAVGDYVNLRANGAALLSVAVDTSGHYLFSQVPAGTYTVDSYDAQSNEAATAAVTVTQNGLVTQNLVLQNSGSVSGTVTTNDGSSVNGLTVTLTSTTTQGTQTLSVTTGSTGGFTFNGVRPGSISLHTVTGSGLQGTATGSLPVAGQAIVINLSLTAAGSVSGIVTQANGSTPAVGVQVTISPVPLTGSATTTTDASGNYTFSNVPFGGFTVYAVNTANGDRGQVSGQIQANGQQRVLNFSLTGFGTVTVKVQDSNGNAISGAAIRVFSGTYATTYSAKSDATGSATVTNVVAGYVSVDATDPVTGLSGSSSVTLAANATVNTTVTLQAVGTVQGTVFGVDGVTPVAGATVQLSRYNTSLTTTTGANGGFSFASVMLGGISLRALDSNGVLRAVASTYLQNSNQVVSVNLTYIGLGTVSGLVTDTDGTRLENAGLQIVSQNSSIGGTQTVYTGGDGTYSASNLPVGKFMVTVQGLPSSKAGYGSGSITADGQNVTLNIQLVSSTVSLPTTLNDADGFPFKIGTYGEFDSAGTLYTNFAYGNAQELTLTVGGASGTFGATGVPTTAIQSLNGQQVEINQPNLAGLNVTRKIYVPSTGYFARRLEVLQNPTSAPITVSVTETGTERYTENTNIYISATSSGSPTLDATSLWVVDDDDQGSQPFPQTQPSVANVFAGAGASVGVASAVNNVTYYSRYTGNGYQSFYTGVQTFTYNTVTIPANSTTSFLFFSAQEAGSSTAITAAKRLVQLPVEALAGLSATDLASVVNFAVPSSPLAAVAAPTTNGVLTGQVFAGDGKTPIPNAVVYEQSTDLYYGTGTSAAADATGLFTLPFLTASSYAVEAVDPATSVRSQAVPGSFPANVNQQTQNIAFTQTGILKGLVQPTGQTQITGGYAYVTLPCLPGQSGYCGSASPTFGTSGVFQLLTVPAGGAGVQASVGLPNGTVYLPGNGAYGVNITAGQTTQFTITVPSTGNITGTVTNADGTPAVGVAVSAYGQIGYFGARVSTDGNGKYAFMSVPLDSYSISSTDPTTNNTVSKPTTVTQDATSVVNLQFIGKNTVVATAQFYNGSVASGVYLYISTSTVPAFTYAGTSDGSGNLTFSNVPTGAFAIRAYYPNQSFFSTTTGNAVGTNQTQQLTVTLPAVGTVSGKVTNADGSSPGANAYVSINDQVNSYSASAQTDSAGNFAFYHAPADRLLNLSSNNPNNNTGRSIQAKAVNQQIPGDGQTLTVNLRYPGLASVHVTALKADGTPYTGGYIGIKSTDGAQNYTQNVGSDGAATFTNVVEGSFVAYVIYNSGFDSGSTTFSVPPAADGTTVQVTIHTSPTGTVQGTVFASDGHTPLSGGNFQVQLLDVLTGNSNGANITGGAYSFTGVQVGASGYQLTAALYDNSASQQTATGNITSEGQVITQNFTLPVWSIAGTVFLYDGVTPAPNANITVAVGPTGSTQFYSGTTDAQGLYQVSGTATGSAVVTASDQSGVSGTLSVNVPSISTILTAQNISLGPAGTVSGTVYNSKGVPQPDQYVQVTVGNDYYQEVYTDGNGYYQATDVAVGNVQVSTYISCGGGASRIVRPNAACLGTQESANGILVHNGDSITINLGQDPNASGQIFGTVYDSNQNPSSGATVTITAASPSTFTTTATTDTNGLYNASNLPLGSVTVQATLSDGSTTNPVTGTIATAFSPVEIDLGLQTAGQVSGIVTDVNGSPIGNIEVNVSSDGDPNSSSSENTAADGSFDFSDIAPGKITLTVIDGSGNTIATGMGVLPYGGNVVINAKTTMVKARNRMLPLPFVPAPALPVLAWLRVGGPMHVPVESRGGE